MKNNEIQDYQFLQLIYLSMYEDQRGSGLQIFTVNLFFEYV